MSSTSSIFYFADTCRMDVGVYGGSALEASTVALVEKLCNDGERKLVASLEETLVRRYQLQDKHQETHDVLSQLAAKSLASIHYSDQARVSALEGQLQIRPTPSLTNDKKRSCGRRSGPHFTLRVCTSGSSSWRPWTPSRPSAARFGARSSCCGSSGWKASTPSTPLIMQHMNVVPHVEKLVQWFIIPDTLQLGCT